VLFVIDPELKLAGTRIGRHQRSRLALSDKFPNGRAVPPMAFEVGLT
jgi:hypothetical protein